ncbi:hypothetical protein IAU59_002089 [Kwoniella sp. CBS 9459]
MTFSLADASSNLFEGCVFTVHGPPEEKAVVERLIMDKTSGAITTALSSANYIITTRTHDAFEVADKLPSPLREKVIRVGWLEECIRVGEMISPGYWRGLPLVPKPYRLGAEERTSSDRASQLDNTQMDHMRDLSSVRKIPPPSVPRQSILPAAQDSTATRARDSPASILVAIGRRQAATTLGALVPPAIPPRIPIGPPPMRHTVLPKPTTGSFGPYNEKLDLARPLSHKEAAVGGDHYSDEIDDDRDDFEIVGHILPRGRGKGRDSARRLVKREPGYDDRGLLDRGSTSTGEANVQAGERRAKKDGVEDEEEDYESGANDEDEYDPRSATGTQPSRKRKATKQPASRIVFKERQVSLPPIPLEDVAEFERSCSALLAVGRTRAYTRGVWALIKSKEEQKMLGIDVRIKASFARVQYLE